MFTTSRAPISAHRDLATIFYSNHRRADAVCLYRIEDDSNYAWREIEEDLSKWLNITGDEVQSLYDNNVIQTNERSNVFTITINISKVKNARVRDRQSIRSAYGKLVSAMKKRA